MLRVLMVTHGTDGDVLPFVRLGRELAGRGHQVTLLGPEPYAAAAGGEFEFAATTSTDAYHRELADTPRLLRAPGPRAMTDFYRRHRIVDTVRREVATLLAYPAAGTVLVGRHTTALSVLVAAEVSGAPAAWAAVSPVQYRTGRVALANLDPILRSDLAGVRAGVGLPPAADWSGWFTGGPAGHHLGLWPAWFDQAGPAAPDGVTLTGFVPPDSVSPDAAAPRPVPEEVAALLAADPPAVLVTGGTGRMLHPRFYQVAVAAARELGRPALVVTRHRDLLDHRLPAGVHWQPWLPFREVFPRVAAVVHHGGIGTLARAAACGTPQLLLAHGFDRADNGDRLARLGLGRWLPPSGWGTGRVVAELAALLARDRPAPPSGAATMDGTAAAADAVEAVGAGPPVPPAAPGTAPTADRVRGLSPERRAALARLHRARSLERR